MKRAQHPRRLFVGATPRSLVVAGTLLIPVVARASEGGLQILPDLPPFLSGLAEAIGAPVGWGLVLLLLFFPLLLVFVNPLVIKPLLRVLDEREERTAGTRSKAERIERDAAVVLARYETSVRETREAAERDRRATLEVVRSEAQRETAAARSEAERRIEQARGEVAAALDDARNTLRSQAQDLARQAASQVLGRAL